REGSASRNSARGGAPRVRGTPMDITVLGGGNGGFATAADLALAGHSVRLWSRSQEALGPLADDPTIVLAAEGRQGTARLARATNLPLGVFPASRTERTIARLAELFPSIRPCADALDAALTNAGPVIHPPLVLLNAGPIDGGRFDIHAAGATSSVRRLIDAVDAERVVTRKGWEYPAPHYELA